MGSKAAPTHAAKAWRSGIESLRDTSLIKNRNDKHIAIVIRGAGIVGLWQALTLARAGPCRHALRALARYPSPRRAAPMPAPCSRPNCEKESADTVVRELGLRGIALWRETYPGTIANGTLVVAPPRDRAELDRFARMTGGHRRLVADRARELEPALADRFAGALYYPEEAHLVAGAPRCLSCSTQAQARRAPACASARTSFRPAPTSSSIAAVSPPRTSCPRLRGVRGERIVVRSREVRSRAARPAAASALSPLCRALGRRAFT